ncbi:MAG: signal recognition particle protein [Deltaproteobacteria bacterium]|nr:signal recognition particle protein [Candidatus Anaeroferrophillus wilburensis]MBN2889082.1 signal recognition particle protein [Deltaproteobacteria bacterium]
MFESLSDKLELSFKKLRGHGRLTEENIKEALRDVRMVLLEADVNFVVVKQFVKAVRERAMGQEVLQSLTPAQQFVKIVHDELVSLMGGVGVPLDLAAAPPVVIMMVGLQGSGKTTTSGKLALHLKKREKKSVLLVPADVYRPAAIDQLQSLGKQIDIPVFSSHAGQDPVDISRDALHYGKDHGIDVLIIDTAGRLHIDEQLMAELERMKGAVKPQEILLVADSMTGQEAVTIAKSFHDLLDITGVVLTKLDGDARGGAALSINAVTGKPIKFVGEGEKLNALDVFYPDRMASRILGMGDVLTLIERAQEVVDEKNAAALAQKLKKNDFNFEDFRTQLQQIKKMGSMGGLLKMIPGLGKVKDLVEDGQHDKELSRVEAIINSMTAKERQDYRLINGSRRKRIAAGSGTTVQDINRLLKNYLEMKKMMKTFNKMGPKGLKKLLQ